MPSACFLLRSFPGIWGLPSTPPYTTLQKMTPWGMVTVALDPGAYTGPTRTNTRRLMGGSPAKVSQGGLVSLRPSNWKLLPSPCMSTMPSVCPPLSALIAAGSRHPLSSSQRLERP